MAARRLLARGRRCGGAVHPANFLITLSIIDADNRELFRKANNHIVQPHQYCITMGGNSREGTT